MSKALFHYRLQFSPRARTVRLRVTVERGLEVIVPRGYDDTQLPAILAHRQRWIRNALDRVEQHRHYLQAGSPWRPPAEIILPALGTVWAVTARETGAASVTVRAAGIAELLLAGAVQDEAACRTALQRWLVREAQRHLIPRLHGISLATGFRYRRGCIKRQKTRWGSCSSRGTVSLNAKLLFCTPEIVEYVLVHELCHLRELNHSQRFWGARGAALPGLSQLAGPASRGVEERADLGPPAMGLVRTA